MSAIAEVEKVLEGVLDKAQQLEGFARHDIIRVEDAVKAALAAVRSTPEPVEAEKPKSTAKK